MIILFIILFTFTLLIIWFSIPYSQLKKEFKKDIEKSIANNVKIFDDVLISEKEIKHLPLTIQNYLINNGYIGKRKMLNMKMEYNNVLFNMDQKSNPLKIDYVNYNFVNQPTRLSLIDSTLFGIPFQGYDYYKDGIGGMKGVIAKSVTVFHQKGSEMDKANLATFLAEILFMPSALLQDYIYFEEISKFEIKATINYKNQSATGIFNFNEKNEMTSFVTDDRAITGKDGTVEYVRWTALCDDYKVTDEGYKHPTKFKAVWNYPDNDFIYFDGEISNINYGY